jgi:two-component system, NarL family, sensor histidine kinase DegS
MSMDDLLRDDYEEDPREQLIGLMTERITAIRRRRNSLKTQIEQTNSIVDREQSRNTDMASDLQSLQANIDRMPQEDIRDKYSEALDIRSRLATMRGQLEKFEAQYEQMEEEQDLLNQILEQFEDVDFGDEDGAEDTGGSSNINIVRIVQAQEDERQRLAERLHDGPAQSLTTFVVQADICARLFDRDQERAAEELENLRDSANNTFQKILDFIFDLQPMMLHDLGVGSTINQYVDRITDKTDVRINVDILNAKRRLDKHREVMVFRTMQELITHGRETEGVASVNVELDMDGDVIKVIVRDDGRGFDAEALFTEDDGSHDSRAQALITMKEKFDLVGGRMSVTSSDQGTLVRTELPAF